MRFIFTTLLLLFAAYVFAQQQDTNSPDSPRYDITVTADRLEQPSEESTESIEVITSEELEETQAATVLEALRDSAGIFILQSGSPGKTASAFIRGANPNQLLVLVDGIEINNPFFGGVEFSQLLTSGIEQIEIVRGAQSTLYGSDAMSGVVNIRTLTGSERFSASAVFEGGSLETFRENIQFGGSAGNWNYQFGGARYDSQGQFENDEWNHLQLNGKVEYSAENSSRFRITSSYFDSHVGIPFNGISESPDRNQDSSLAIVGADFEKRWNTAFNLTSRASYARRDFLFVDPDDNFSPRSEDQSDSYKVAIQNDSLIGSSSVLTTGFEQEWQNITARDVTSEFLDEQIRATSFFAHNKLTSGRWIVSAGGRYDHHNSFGGHFSPRISTAFRMTTFWKLRASAAGAFRAPSAGELAYPFYGNQNLKPERSRSFEAGSDLNLRNTGIAVTAFFTRYSDLITFDPVTFLAANINRATSNGFEASATHAFSERWKINGAYTLLFTRDLDADQPLFRRPKHSGSLGLHYQSERWNVNGNLTLIGERFERDFSASLNRFNPGYMKADLSGFYRISRHLRLSARLENFLDEDYAEALAFPAPGLTAYAGLHFNL